MIYLAPAFITAEAWPLNWIIKARQEAPQLYGAGRDDYYLFKLKEVKARHPQLLVLGSSRSMQFRNYFVHKQPDVFYNAGGAAQCFGAALEFLKQLSPQESPKVLLLAIDNHWLGPGDANDLNMTKTEKDFDELDLAARHLVVAPDLWRRMLENHSLLEVFLKRREPLYHQKALGIFALIKGNGFRSDGSFLYGSHLRQMPSWQSRAKESLEGILADHFPYRSMPAIHAENLKRLEALLQLAQARGMQVIGFSTPFSPVAFDLMQKTGRYSYLKTLVSTLEPLFKKYGYSYSDFTDPKTLGLENLDFLDPSHPMERSDLKIFRHLIMTNTAILQKYADPVHLEQLILSIKPGTPYPFDPKPDSLAVD